jgi:3-oxoadipate CoA-transferase beta subunit
MKIGHRHPEKLTRAQMAERVANDVPAGAVVNLGIGIPTQVSNYLKPEHEIILHTENGMLGMGPEAHGDDIDTDLLNAGKKPVTEAPGCSYFHHADSFAIMRGGHLDIAVLGAFQVSQNGDLANWHTGEPEAIPAVGGAMDLAVGAKDVFVIMELMTKTGTSKLVSELSYGQQRQLEIGMALAGAPRLILFDEPAAGLSPAERRELVLLLGSLPAHMSFVIIEHDLDIALRVSQRVTVMHNGRVLRHGTPAEIESDPQVQALYMGGRH